MRSTHWQFAIASATVAMFTALGLPAASRPRAHGNRDLPVRDQETIRKSFDVAGAAPLRLEVDNVNGAIEVVGADSNQVQLVVVRSTRAESQAKLEEARNEVTLDIKQETGLLSFYVDGPFRCRCDDRHSVWFGEDEGYWVEIDFQLQVPRTIDLTLRTVNSGDINVRDVKGAYAVRNVNGGIEMLRVAGSGTAHTVNGSVKVIFRENPRENSSFKSINGDIDLYFARDLAADFRFKTFNGAIYSDFVVTSLPARAMQTERKGSRTVFRSDRFTSARVGAGGIEIKAENLNGDIRIRENKD